MAKTIIINEPLSRELTTCGGITQIPMSTLEAATIVQTRKEFDPGRLARLDKLYREGKYRPSLSVVTRLTAGLVLGGGVIQA